MGIIKQCTHPHLPRPTSTYPNSSPLTPTHPKYLPTHLHPPPQKKVPPPPPPPKKKPPLPPPPTQNNAPFTPNHPYPK